MAYGVAGPQRIASICERNRGLKPELGRVGEHLATPSQSRENGCQRRLHDIVAAADTAGAIAIDIELYVTHCLRVGTLAQRVLRVLNHYDMPASERLHGLHKGVDHPVTLASQRYLSLRSMQRDLKPIGLVPPRQLVICLLYTSPSPRDDT